MKRKHRNTQKTWKQRNIENIKGEREEIVNEEKKRNLRVKYKKKKYV